MNIKTSLKLFFNELIRYAKIKKKITYTILAIAFFLILILIILSNTKKPQNSIYNLKNGGFVVNKNGTIYCLGNTDGIYRVKGKNKQQISVDKGQYLNLDDKYIYYLDNSNNIVRINYKGQDKKTIIENVDEREIYLKDNYIYYFKNTYLYKAKTNGEDKNRICNQNIETFQIMGDYIYYSYKEDGKYVIAKTKMNGGGVEKIDNDTGKAFIVKGNKIYYIHEENDINNYRTNFGLWTIKINGKNKKKVVDISGTIDTNTVVFANKYIYFIKENEENKIGIYKIKMNGKSETEITGINDNSTKINVINNIIYYKDINENGEISTFSIKTNGKNKKSI